MTNDTYQRELDVAVEAARGAGRIQMEHYERLERIVHKSEHDVVTEVDHLSEDLIIATVRRAFPGDAVLAEESGRSSGAAADSKGDGRAKADGHAASKATDAAPVAAVGPNDRLWVVDPLDGTINYANGIPFFCCAVSLVVGGRPVVGVIYDPSRNELFSARAGFGAQLDGVSIHHPAKARLVDSVVSLALPPSRFSTRERKIRKAIRVARNMGSAALSLAYVGNGRFDAMVQAGGLSLWDLGAAGLIALEAGAKVTAPDGGLWFDLRSEPHKVGVLAASVDHHQTLLEMLK